MTPQPKPRKRRKPSPVRHLRDIADRLEREGYTRFPIFLRAAAKDFYGFAYEIGQLKARVTALEKRSKP